MGDLNIVHRLLSEIALAGDTGEGHDIIQPTTALSSSHYCC